MNILPKKSWHVRTRKNIDRVQRDEAEASEKARIELDRKLRIEQEIRLKELRARAGATTEKEASDHSILFDDDQKLDGSGSSEEDKKLIARAKLDEGRWHEKLGLSGKLVKDEDITQPWYCKNARIKINPPSSSYMGPNQSYDKNVTMSSIYSTHKKLYAGEKPSPDQIRSIYDPMIAMKQADELCRARRANKKRLKSSQSGDTSRLEFSSSASRDRERSSSPEIIDVIQRKSFKS